MAQIDTAEISSTSLYLEKRLVGEHVTDTFINPTAPTKDWKRRQIPSIDFVKKQEETFPQDSGLFDIRVVHRQARSIAPNLRADDEHKRVFHALPNG